MPDARTTPASPEQPAPAAPAPPTSLHLQYTLQEDDLQTLYAVAWSLDPAIRRQWEHLRKQFRIALGIALGATSLLALGCIMFALGMIRSYESAPFLAICLAAAAVGAWWTTAQYLFAIRPFSLERNALAFAHSEEAAYQLGPQSITITPAGLTLSTIHHDTTQRWSGITHIRATESAVYIFRADRACYVIPASALTSPAEVQSVATLARTWLDQSGHGDHRRIREHLAAHDTPCPNCNYNLRGITTPTCPECSYELDITITTKTR